MGIHVRSQFARSLSNVVGCAVIGLSFLPLSAAAQQSPTPSQASEVVLRDATPVYLRFARPLYGTVAECRKFWQPCDSPRLVKAGEAVRLLVAADVLVNQQLVIAKGAVAEAHVKNTYGENRTLFANNNNEPFDPGFTLVLDWVQAINGERINLRAAEKGKAHWFSVRIIGTGGGVQVIRNTMKHDLGWIYTGGFRRETYHARDWIPAGARLTAYVHHDAKFSLEELAKAQEALPARNPLAVVTIYRTKGSGDQPIKVFCDTNLVGSLQQNEYLTTELSSGAHSCNAENADALKLSVDAGDEVFLHLHNRVLAGSWELKAVGVSEGEDSIVKSQYVNALR